MRTPQKRNPGLQAGAGMLSGERRFHDQSATVEALLQRLEGVLQSGAGWRAKCPACGGRERTLSIGEADDRVLLNCFKCSDTGAVLAAVGLTWADLMPPRHWPESPAERKAARRAIREAGWASALTVLALESKVTQAAARQLEQWMVLSVEDDQRLAQAVERIDRACAVLVDAATFKPVVSA